MTEEMNTPLAGGSDDTSLAGDGGAPLTGLTEESAISRLMELEDTPAPQNIEGEKAEDAPLGDLRDQDPVAAGAEAEGNANEDDPDAEPSADGEDNTPDGNDKQPAAENDPKAVSLDKLTGDTKVILSDGSVYSGADIKRDIDTYRNARHYEQQVMQKAQQLQGVEADLKQRADQFMHTAPVAMQALQDTLPEVPPMPPRELMDQDWSRYQLEMDAHTRAKADWQEKSQKIQNIAQEYQRQQAANAQAQDQQTRQNKAYHQQKLLEKMPELQDPAKYQSFFNDLYAYTGREFGVTPQEMNLAFHHAVHVMGSKAMAYDKLMAEKPTAVKKEVVKAPPKQQPGRPGKRPTKEEATAQKRADWKARVNRTGGLNDDEAVRLILEGNL